MASKKKLENVALQIECENDAQWKQLLRREGLIVVDVYAGWAGPCLSMLSILKRVKVEINNDRFWLGTANTDNISDLLMFKDQSEPCWLFIGGGKPVRVMRGSNAPKLIAAMKSEFEHELKCIAGKAKRTIISIDDEVTRRRKAEEEAVRLSKFVKDEEDSAKDLDTLRQKSSIQLQESTEAFTVIVIQSYLLDTGAVTEIRDSLEGEFKIERERLMTLDEEEVRNLFRIPREIPDPASVPPPEKTESQLQNFGYDEPESGQENQTGDMGENEAEQNEQPETDGGETEEDGYGSPTEMTPKKKKKKAKLKMIPVLVPAGLVGETLFMLVESYEMRKQIASGVKSGGVFQTADDYIQVRAGPIELKDALEHAPFSWHALYGREKYACGVWVPRRYDDKRHVMINYFPRFVTELLVPAGPGKPPKYMVAVYPSAMAPEVTKEVDFHRKDILAEGQVKVAEDLAEEMLQSWNTPAAQHQEKKTELTKPKVYALSVDKKNSALMLALRALEPLHISYDPGYGKIESARLFENLKISLKDTPNPDLVVEKFLARSAPRIITVQDLDEPGSAVPSTMQSQTMMDAPPSESAMKIESTDDSSPSAAAAEPTPAATEIQPTPSGTEIQAAQPDTAGMEPQPSNEEGVANSASAEGIQPSKSEPTMEQQVEEEEEE